MSFYQDLSQGLKSTGPLQPSVQGVTNPSFLLEYINNPSKCFGVPITAYPYPSLTNFNPSYSPDEEVGRAADAFELILDFAEKPPF